MTAGLATFDYDGDGLIDIYFLNGRPLPGREGRQAAPETRSTETWAISSSARSPTRPAWATQASAWESRWPTTTTTAARIIYVSNFGPNVLYHNNGDGTFTDVTAKAGVGRGHKVGAGACFLDMDGDGNLDLYAANYVKFTYEHPATRSFGGYLRYPGPNEFDPQPGNLFRNNGDGTFSDVSVRPA